MNKFDPAKLLKDELREHFSQVILPIWQSNGFNRNLRLPFEAVVGPEHVAGPVSRYRAMACARQLFVFSQAGLKQHAEILFESLIHYFRNSATGGWFYSIDPEGKPLDTTNDLYTHAFVVFACAEYKKQFANSDALDILRRTSAVIEEKFTAQQGLFNSALDERFASVTGTPIQNPMMHLTEAWLAAFETTADASFSEALVRLGKAISQHFVYPASGCVAELPIGTADNLIEPGHQFEWFWLVKRAGKMFEEIGLTANLTRALDFSQTHGVDQSTGGVAAALDETGTIIDSTQRIWAQTEYLRALAVLKDDASKKILAQQLVQFRNRFLSSTGWIESMTSSGEPVRIDMPSTTPYHLATAYAEFLS